MKVWWNYNVATCVFPWGTMLLHVSPMRHNVATCVPHEAKCCYMCLPWGTTYLPWGTMLLHVSPMRHNVATCVSHEAQCCYMCLPWGTMLLHVSSPEAQCWSSINHFHLNYFGFLLKNIINIFVQWEDILLNCCQVAYPPWYISTRWQLSRCLLS